jgi:GNAT superfamily N-acetyltransferase
MNIFAQRTREPDFIVRKMKPEDRDQIRHICCETGFLGEPIDSVFGDRDLFADFLTRYYTDIEPESCWVGEKKGQVVGYLAVCRRQFSYRWWSVWNGIRLASKAAWRWIRGQYDSNTRKYFYWIITRSWRETPPAPPESAHCHLNSLKEHRKMGIARDLLMAMFDEMQKQGVKRVYGQMATFDHRRSDRVYRYMGWDVLNKVRITKYRDMVDKEIYLTTVVREFES